MPARYAPNTYFDPAVATVMREAFELRMGMAEIERKS